MLAVTVGFTTHPPNKDYLSDEMVVYLYVEVHSVGVECSCGTYEGVSDFDGLNFEK